MKLQGRLAPEHLKAYSFGNGWFRLIHYKQIIANTVISMITPKQIKRLSSTELQINWSDLRQDIIPSIILRKNCPCAACAEQRGDLNHSKPLSAPSVKKGLLSIVSNTIEEEISLIEVWGIGNYALGCRWGDGHATGIYTYTKLRSICDEMINSKLNSQTSESAITQPTVTQNIGTASDH